MSKFKMSFFCLAMIVLLLFVQSVPLVAETTGNTALTMLGATINPDLGALRFGAKYTASYIPKGATVASMGMLICEEQKLTGTLSFNANGQLTAGIENLKPDGIINFSNKKSFSSYTYIDYYVTKSGFTINTIDTSYLARAYLSYKISGRIYYVYSDIISRTYRYIFETSFPGMPVRVGDVTIPDNNTNDYMRAMWVSQYDMNSVYVYGGVQRSTSSYTSLVNTMIANIKKDGFNTIFLQMRPFGDSMYQSQYYPLSRFVAGSYGGSISYDPIQIFITQANAVGISVHGWINPLRLMLTTEIPYISDNYMIKQWYNTGSDRVIDVGGRLYLNPVYEDVRQLICNGAAEILNKYNVDGIQIDDYFYPTTSASFDAASFSLSGYTSLSAFRENNINSLVKGLYQTVHTTDSKAVFGVSPAGNLANLRSSYYVDAAKWCSEDGYIDYILPQLYFGFLHGTCPFDTMVENWSLLVTNPNVKYYVGLSGGNAFNAYNGEINIWAGTEEGKYEWINNKDVLKRSFEYILANSKVDGYSFFCYQYLYSPTTGIATINLDAEYNNFIGVITK